MTTYDHDSVFGNTICGVPNPLVPHVHPYPTRYHGPWFGTVSQNATYRENPFMNPVNPGPGLSGCSACLRGLGEDSTAPLFRSATGSGIFDAAIGGAVAAVISRPQDRVMAGVVGAMLSYFAGTLGLIAGVGGAVYMRQRRTGAMT